MDIETLALSKNYTRQTVEGLGAIKGKNCTITNIKDDEDGNTVVTFSWTKDDGTKVEQYWTIKKGKDGVSISNIEVDEEKGTFTIKYSDDTQSDPITLPKQPVNISKDEGNALKEGTDKGLYVGASAVNISKEEGNIIKEKEDGLFASADKISISKKEKNILTTEDDGLYVPETDLSDYTKTEDFDELAEKVAEIELFKFPNAVIHGTPAINNGHVSDFSNANYLVFPSVFNLSGRGFEFKFAFTTKDDVTVPQNILGGKFCMALFIQSEKLNLRVSSNGTSWDIVNLEGSATIEASKTYYVKINFTRLNYVLSLSTDDETYNEIGSVSTGDISPNPAEIYIGVGNNFNNPFKGIINLNKCYLKVNQSIIWQGMDDAGLATRLATDLDNIDDDGIEAIKEIAETHNKADKISVTELKILGWTVPSEMSLKNDVEGNKFIQKIARVDLGTLDWQYRSSDGLMLCQTPLESKAIAETDAPNIYCGAYKALPRSGTESVANTDKSIALPNRYTIIHDRGYTDGTAYKTAIKGTYLYYELATPIEKVIEDNELLVGIYDDGFASAKAVFTTTDQFIDGNGSISDSDTYKLSDYIKTDNDSSYCCWSLLQIREVDAYIRVAKYNSAKVFIARDVYLIDKTEKYKVIDTSNCEYVRICYDSDDNLHFGKFNDFVVMDSMPNTTLTTEISRKELELAELKMLGWTVPKECPTQNSVAGNQFTQRVGRVDLGSLDWTYNRLFTQDTYKCKPSDDSKKANIYCAKYNTESNNDIFNRSVTGISINDEGNIRVNDPTYTDANTFKTAMNGQYLYYELETPVTKQIDGNEITAIEEESKFTTIHTVRNGQNYIKKVGKVCTVSLNIQLTSDQNAYTTIATIPNGFEPANQFFAVDADVNTGVLISNGKVVQFTKAQKSGDIVAFSATYVTN